MVRCEGGLDARSINKRNSLVGAKMNQHLQSILWSVLKKDNTNSWWDLTINKCGTSAKKNGEEWSIVIHKKKFFDKNLLKKILSFDNKWDAWKTYRIESKTITELGRAMVGVF